MQCSHDLPVIVFKLSNINKIFSANQSELVELHAHSQVLTVLLLTNPVFPSSLLKVWFLSLLSALQSVFIVPTSACHVNFDGVLEEGDGPTASEDSLAFSEDSLSSSSSFLHFRSAQVLSLHLLHAHPNLVLFYNQLLSLSSSSLTPSQLLFADMHMSS